MKKMIILARTSFKLILIALISTIIIGSLVVFIYKPIYSVKFKGEFIGYSDNKSELQKKINDYIEKGEGENVAFVEIAELPEYELCLLKKGIVANDEEIYAKVKETGSVYYRYYALTKDGEEKQYVSSFEEAEKIINEIKQKDGGDNQNIGLIEKFEKELKDFTNSETAVASLYVAPPVVVVAKVTKTYTSTKTSINTSSNKISLGISLIRPISGTISSRYGRRSSGTHTGLDIAAPTGTIIKAAAAGTVTFVGWSGSYGNLIKISHGNGIETYYAHCSSISASVGNVVAQGDKIAYVGSTGNSTGSHLHLEVRINGTTQNPQNYVY